jgi:long-subunit fatty acid transport protein
MKFICLFILITALSFSELEAQENPVKANPAKTQYLDLGLGFGASQTSISGSYLHNWHLGEKKKFFLGLGARITSQFGNNVYYTSAPANLASDDMKVDSVFITSPMLVSINAVLNLGYRFNNKFQAGFNIDAIGFSLGGEKAAIFTSGGSNTDVVANATSFNVLLIGNNDRGSLNSQFYLQYDFKPNLGVKAAYQYLFTEYTTKTKVQQIPESNDRFRNKASMGYVGLVYKF